MKSGTHARRALTGYLAAASLAASASAQFGPLKVISSQALGAIAVHAADIDGDGHIDFLSASAFDDKIAWYENLTPSFSSYCGPAVANSAGQPGALCRLHVAADPGRRPIGAGTPCLDSASVLPLRLPFGADLHAATAS